MHSVMRSDFLNRFLSLDRFQRDSRLHVCAEAPPLPRFHSAPFRGSRFYTLFTGPNFGEQLMLPRTAPLPFGVQSPPPDHRRIGRQSPSPWLSGAKLPPLD